MKQFAIIGLDGFGLRVLEELLHTQAEILIVDKDETVIADFRDLVSAAYVADAIKEETIAKIVPPDVDAAVVDLGDRTEVSILVVNYLKKLGVKRIVAKAESDEHGEILKIIGATDVIFPNREAAKRVLPPLLSESMFSYMPISDELVMAEVKFPPELTGKTIIEADVRNSLGVNVVAVKPPGESDFRYISLDYQFGEADRFLVVGTNEKVSYLSETAEETRKLARMFRLFFNRKD